jgi:hypothetical protein
MRSGRVTGQRNLIQSGLSAVIQPEAVFDYNHQYINDLPETSPHGSDSNDLREMLNLYRLKRHPVAQQCRTQRGSLLTRVQKCPIPFQSSSRISNVPSLRKGAVVFFRPNDFYRYLFAILPNCKLPHNLIAVPSPSSILNSTCFFAEIITTHFPEGFCCLLPPDE